MEELENLKQKIKQAKEDYYQTGKSSLTDQEYDRLVDKAEKLGYIETVGANPVKEIPEIKHEHLMLSLDKAHTVEELRKFISNKDYVLMWKADGLTCSCTYEDGILTRLETRGNGEIGNDVLFHANSIENLPKVINKTGRYVIDGECVILYTDFEKINEKLPETERYSNPRNLAAGSLNQLDSKISATRHLKFYAWDVIEGEEYDSLYDNLIDATKLGFETVQFLRTNDVDHLSDLLNIYRSDAKEKGFPIDGCVLKFDSKSYGESLGRTAKFFRNALAYKYEDDRYETKLIKVDFQVGKTGQITPVAYFEPVEIDGSIVEKSSLHNLSIMKQLHLTKGCTVYVYKANSIIPQIDYADLDGDGDIEIIDRCPICSAPTKIVKQNDSEVLYCTNDKCPGKLLGKLSHFVSKKGLDIDGLSEQTLEVFIKLGYVNNFEDIFAIAEHKEEIMKIPGFGKRSVDKLLAAIEKSKNCSLDHFICALSIDGIGSSQSKILAETFKTWNSFYKAAIGSYDFTRIETFGKERNKNIHQWFVNNDINSLVSYISFTDSTILQRSREDNNSLEGKTFVVTGSVHIFKNRDELKSKIESLGGKVSGSVSKNTDFLINNDVDSSSSKNAKAKELNIPIISEEDFVNMIGGDNK